MVIGIPREIMHDEGRVSATPETVKKMKADGLDVISFGAGEPDFDTPSAISLAGVKAICEGQTRYTPAAGTISLRKAICKRVM